LSADKNPELKYFEKTLKNEIVRITCSLPLSLMLKLSRGKLKQNEHFEEKEIVM